MSEAHVDGLLFGVRARSDDNDCVDVFLWESRLVDRVRRSSVLGDDLDVVPTTAPISKTPGAVS